MGSIRQQVNNKIKDPNCEFREIYLCLKQLGNPGRSDWGNRVASPLIVAVECNRQDMVVVLVKHFKVDVNSVDQIYSEGGVPRQRTALHRSVDLNNGSMAIQLMRLGADPLRLQAWSQLPHMGMVYGSALDNAIFGRHYAVQKSIETFARKEVEKKRPVIQIIVGTPPPFTEETEIKKPTESRRRPTILETFNDKVFEFFELSTEFQVVESRVVGEKRPKMDQILSMESFISHERDRKNFVEYDDLKIMEKHLNEYVAMQAETGNQSSLEEEASEIDKAESIQQQVMEDLGKILQCKKCFQFPENLSARDPGPLVAESRRMFTCQGNHVVCNTCSEKTKAEIEDLALCPCCDPNEASTLRRNYLAEKLIETLNDLTINPTGRKLEAIQEA